MSPIHLAEVIEKTQRIVNENLANPNFSLPGLCRQVGYSYSHLHHIIKTETGMTLAHFVREQRLRAAERLLAEMEMNISEICFAVGFKDPNYFTRVFRLKHKMSPRAWRLQNQSVV